MLLYEIEKGNLRKCNGDLKKVIQSGLYIPRDNAFIKNAFNFGNGTIKHMNNYMKNNACFCIWIDSATMEKITRL